MYYLQMKRGRHNEENSLVRGKAGYLRQAVSSLELSKVKEGTSQKTIFRKLGWGAVGIQGE